MKTFANAFLLLLLLAGAAPAHTSFTVTGITGDKTTYSDSLTIGVTVEAGYTCALYLNGTNVSAGCAYTIRNPDFSITQSVWSNNTTEEATNRYFPIIV